MRVEKRLPDATDSRSSDTEVSSLHMNACGAADDAKMCASKLKNIGMRQNAPRLQDSPDMPSKCPSVRLWY